MSNFTPCNDSDCSDATGKSPAEQLNHNCFCTTLDRDKLDSVLQTDAIHQDILQTHPQLFSNTSVFISPQQFSQMQSIVDAVEHVVSLASYQQPILNASADSALFNAKNAGVFMGYDFHLSPTGPQIIEINTNAGGGFLNAALMNAQTECCRAANISLPAVKKPIDEQFIAMFLREWRHVNPTAPLTRIAIVDDKPSQQFLFPEFRIAQRLFKQHGIDAVIADPSELLFEHNHLMFEGQAIDLVYNRLTDFLLTDEKYSALRSAYVSNAVVLTPNPRHHALYADKRNLTIFSDKKALTDVGASEQDIAILLVSIPFTQIVTPENAEQLWQERKHLFFKPAAGFGSRAAYRGDKLTKRVWAEILQSDYVAQQLVPPSERGILVDDHEVAVKVDIRAYAYEGNIQLLAARLYQGQTTNFRTQGGGFAPVFVVG